MATVSEVSQAAVNRPDLHAYGLDKFTKFGLNREGRMTIISHAAQLEIAGKVELNFPNSDMLLDSDSNELGERAPYGKFDRGREGNFTTVDARPVDRGKGIDIDRSDDFIKNQLLLGKSMEDIRADASARSVAKFCESIEYTGVTKSGGLGNATTPFTNADIAVGGTWNTASSTIFANFATARNTLDTYCEPNGLFMGLSVANALRAAPELTAMFGGYAEIGQLTMAQVAKALEVDFIAVGFTSLYGEYVSFVEQYPGMDAMEWPSAVIYYFDREGVGQDYGLQYSVETVAGTHNKVENVLAHANCGVCVNPNMGIRFANVLT